jgi:gas vesicle protein
MGKWFKGAVAGGVLGLIAGLLFAPQKGEDTRKKLQEAMEKAKKVGEGVKEKGEALAAKAKQKWNETLESESEG